MIRQDDILLNTMSEYPFKEYGCALFDIIYLAVMKGSYVFKRESFIHDVDNWIKAGVLDKNLKVLSWDKLALDSGLPYRIVIENGTHKLPKERKVKDNEIQCLYLYNPETQLHHFVVGDKYDRIIYDSLGESVTGKAYEDGIGYIESKRIMRRIQ